MGVGRCDIRSCCNSSLVLASSPDRSGVVVVDGFLVSVISHLKLTFEPKSVLVSPERAILHTTLSRCEK